MALYGSMEVFGEAAVMSSLGTTRLAHGYQVASSDGAVSEAIGGIHRHDKQVAEEGTDPPPPLHQASPP